MIVKQEELECSLTASCATCQGQGGYFCFSNPEEKFSPRSETDVLPPRDDVEEDPAQE